MDHTEMSLSTFYDEWYEPLKLRSRRPRTRDLYRVTLAHFDDFLQRCARLSDFDDDTVSRYLAWFRKLPRAPASVNKERNNLLAIWRFACRKRLVDKWPDVDPEVEPERIPVAWTDTEIRQLFAAAAKFGGLVDVTPASLWWTALLFVLWDTGERIGAMLGIKWRDVDLESGYVLCRAEVRKGGKRDRLYRLEPDSIAAVRVIRKPWHNQNTNVFHWPFHDKYLWFRYGQLLKAANLPNDGRSKFHRVRRTVASYCEANGGNATELLDHSRRSVTLAYLDPRIVKPHFATDYLFRPTAPPTAPQNVQPPEL